jgi:beta-lactamase class A
MAFILERIYRRNLVDKNVSNKCMELLKLQRITDRIPKYLPVDITIAHKSGLERGICHDVGIVFSKKGDFLICVLTQHKDSNSILSKEFIAKISLYTYNYFEQLP